MILHKSFDLDFKADDAGGFSAYVARFNNVDRTDEVIEPGAFKNLDGFLADGWIGVNHDMKSLPVAYVEHASQDEHGLLVSAKWHGTADAQACRTIVNERLKAGRSVKCSIGYRVLDSAKDRLDGKAITRLKSLDLFEASIVNLPANPAASVISAKSHDGEESIKAFEDALLASGRSDDVLPIDALLKWLAVEKKAGRVLSRSNHAKIREWRGTLESMLSQLAEMCDQHDPDRADEPTEPAPLVEYVPDGKSLEKLRAASLRARLALLQPSI